MTFTIDEATSFWDEHDWWRTPSSGLRFILRYMQANGQYTRTVMKRQWTATYTILWTVCYLYVQKFATVWLKTNTEINVKCQDKHWYPSSDCDAGEHPGGRRYSKCVEKVTPIFADYLLARPIWPMCFDKIGPGRIWENARRREKGRLWAIIWRKNFGFQAGKLCNVSWKYVEGLFQRAKHKTIVMKNWPETVERRIQAMVSRHQNNDIELKAAAIGPLSECAAWKRYVMWLISLSWWRNYYVMVLMTTRQYPSLSHIGHEQKASNKLYSHTPKVQKGGDNTGEDWNAVPFSLWREITTSWKTLSRKGKVNSGDLGDSATHREAEGHACIRRCYA